MTIVRRTHVTCDRQTDGRIDTLDKDDCACAALMTGRDEWRVLDDSCASAALLKTIINNGDNDDM